MKPSEFSSHVSGFYFSFLLTRNQDNKQFPFGIGINKRDGGITKESELLWFTEDDFNEKHLSDNGEFFSSRASAWSVNELSDSEKYIIERPTCASTDEFDYATIDSKTLTLLWSAPGDELSVDKWKSKLVHFEEYGNPPKAGCDASKDEFCEDYTGTVQRYLLTKIIANSLWAIGYG